MTGPRERPEHPGRVLWREVLRPLRLTQAELAKRLRVSRRTVSQIVNARRPLTPDMALRLGRLLRRDPEPWLHAQIALDLWILRARHDYGRIHPVHRSTLAQRVK